MATLTRFRQTSLLSKIALAGAIWLVSAVPHAALGEELGLARGLAAATVDCSSTLGIGFQERCSLSDFSFPQTPVPNPGATRLQLRMNNGQTRWVRSSVVRFNSEVLGGTTSNQPRSNGTRISTAPHPISDGKMGTIIAQAESWSIDAGPGDQAFALAPADAKDFESYKAMRLSMPLTEARISVLLSQLDGGWPHDSAMTPKPVIIASDQYAAAALPDNVIVIPMGLLRRARSDDELAFILAHELAHFRLGDFAAGKIKRANDQGLQAMIATAALVYMVTSDSKKSKLAVLSVAAMGYAAISVSRPAWSRHREDVADALAFDLVNTAGLCATAGSQAVFTALADNEIATARRTARAADSVTASAAAETFAAQAHQTAERRAESLRRYAIAAYPQGLPACEVKAEALSGIRSATPFRKAATAVAALTAATQVDLKTSPGQVIDAIRPALSTDYVSTPMIGNTAAAAYAALGEIDRADQIYGLVLPNPDQTLEAHVAHAGLLLGAGRYARASEVASIGLDRYGGDNQLSQLQIKAFFHQGRLEETARGLQTCLTDRRQSDKVACARLYIENRQSFVDALKPDQVLKLDALVSKYQKKVAKR